MSALDSSRDVDIDVLVLADLNPDVLVHGCPDPVHFGQVDSPVQSATLTLGGSGAITAVAAARLGLKCAVVGVVGADAAGGVVLAALAEADIDTRAVQVRHDAPTGMTIALNVATRPGDRAMLTAMGNLAELRAADIDGGLIARARHVHVASYFLQLGLRDGLAQLLAHARMSGASTSLDPGWDPEQRWEMPREVLAQTSYLMPNETELQHLAAARRAGTARMPDPAPVSSDTFLRGTPPPETNQADAELYADARELATLGPDVVLKRGPLGAAYVTSQARWTHAGDRVDPVDTTGAGDNFDAGFLWALLGGADLPRGGHQGPDPRDLLVAGARAGAIAVGGVGGTACTASPQQLRAALGRQSQRAKLGIEGGFGAEADGIRNEMEAL